jgi:hypothetical protein
MAVAVSAAGKLSVTATVPTVGARPWLETMME